MCSLAECSCQNLLLLNSHSMMGTGVGVTSKVGFGSSGNVNISNEVGIGFPATANDGSSIVLSTQPTPGLSHGSPTTKLPSAMNPNASQVNPLSRPCTFNQSYITCRIVCFIPISSNLPSGRHKRCCGVYFSEYVSKSSCCLTNKMSLYCCPELVSWPWLGRDGLRVAVKLMHCSILSVVCKCDALFIFLSRRRTDLLSMS
jgi:hypothetical protein